MYELVRYNVWYFDSKIINPLEEYYEYNILKCRFRTIMSLAQGAPLLSRLVSSSVAIASQAGHVIRDVMKKGDLGIVEKEVRNLYRFIDFFYGDFVK